MNKRTFLAAACSAVAVAALPAANAYAQATYPDKPIRVIMPWAAGGPTDVVGRVIAVQMGEILGQPLVIETRAGASGTIGTAQVAKAPADGYTLLMNPSVQGIYPAQFKNLSFDPIKDFKMVGVLGTVPMVAVVPPDSKFESFGDLIKQAQAQPGSLSFASPGVATLPHLAGELINTSTKTKITHVGYRGSSPALTDVAGGHVDLMYAPPWRRPCRSSRAARCARSPSRPRRAWPNCPTCRLSRKPCCPGSTSSPGTACGRRKTPRNRSSPSSTRS